MFTDLIKRKAKELGLELVNEIKETVPRHEKIQKSGEISTPAEIMIAEQICRR